ncbi:prion-inhibition and propagation domain-containing protein [Purpureocillium lavendulum]|uniref:Prion-inhibition and propagation domain-containing protein n=1 Tax=Purpureocillium lavendulum TaxID=1247861 RepID=A0AB34G0U1_9HYPO|nr:prion-inhibition and propagation domain-containing protein [Purpureocillium lavendulum]
MSGLEIAGVPLAVAGLLLSVKGAVDGYNMLADVCAKDTGLDFAKTQYLVEEVKFQVWARRVRADDEANCLLLKQPRMTRDAVWRIVAEINATHELAVDFVAKFHAEPVPLPNTAAAVAGQETFHRQSKWVAMMAEARAKIPKRHRISWVARHRDSFTNLISRLGVLNKDLWDVMASEEVDTVSIVTGVLSGLNDQLSLVTLQNSPHNDPASLLALAAHLKQLQGKTVSELAAKVKSIDSSELSVLQAESNNTANRFQGTFTDKAPGSLPEPVWIEWKAIGKSSYAMNDILVRIHALGALLSATNAAAFHRPACLGVYDDERYRERTDGSRRVGLVYRSIAANGLPVPLSRLLINAREARTRPALGVRFDLAYKLASAVSLLHATDWIHKSLRSDNILFASEEADALAAPQIAGIQYSRPEGDASLEGRPTQIPELDMYYPPNVVMGASWTKFNELYSLGIVLLEIAHWRPLFEERYRRLQPGQVSRAILDDLEDKFGVDLEGLVGRVFVNVIKRCLTGSFGVPGGLSRADESKALSDAFFDKVVKPLAKLKA